MAQTNRSDSTQNGENRLSEDLVRQVAQRVYELWQEDARIEAERRRLARSRWKRS